MRYRIVATVVLVAVVVIGIFYIAGRPRDSSLSQLQQQNRIRIGYAVEAPYAYIGNDGDVTGESPEVAKVIAKSLGIDQIEWVQTDFDLLIAGLLDDRFDVIAAGMFITPERAQKVRFSSPTFHVLPGLLVASGNPLNLHSYRYVADHASATVAVIDGSVEETYMRAAGITDAHLIVVPDALTGQTTVTSGLADGLALSSVTVRWIARNDSAGTTEVADPFSAAAFDPEWGYGAFAFRPDDLQLIDGWNAALASFIGSDAHIDLISRFGFTLDELPNDLSQ